MPKPVLCLRRADPRSRSKWSLARRTLGRTTTGGLAGLVAVLTVALTTPVSADGVTPVKGPRDDRDYRYLVLDNRLRVLLISDSTADKAAAALDLDIGSRHDPDERLGFAHFLEHMLFLGTEKFPEAGEYQRYISSHGGSNNASTGFEHTNYYFELDQAHLRGALERFSQFFVAPLLDAEYVDRERNAVHSEYQARLKSDGSRTWDATKQVFNAAHPLSRFSVGSLKTLTNEQGKLRQDLIEFQRRHYSANRMTLVVYGKESLETLEQWVVELFGPIEDRDVVNRPVDVPLFKEGRLPALLEVTPERDLRTLSLDFPIPSTLAHFRSKPTYYISNLLGHEGKGSLLSLLKAKGWSDGLSSGVGFQSRDAALFRVNVRLTADGLAHVPEVIGHVLQTVSTVREEGFAAWRQTEQARLLELGFRFQESSSPMEYSVALARAMHVYPPEETLRGPYLLTEPDGQLIEEYLDLLTPGNMLVTVQAKGLRTQKRSPYYDAPYDVWGVPEPWVELWQDFERDPQLVLPGPNEFVPERLALKSGDLSPERPSVKPDGAPTDAGSVLVHQGDPSFTVPKANVYVSVRSPKANDTVRHRVLTELYLRLVRDQLQEFTYPASLAGLDYDLYPHLRGFTLRVSGYDDKLGVLLERLVGSLGTLEVDPGRFAIEVDDLRRRLANQSKARSFRIAMRGVSRMLLERSWTEEEQLDVLKAVTPADVEAFVPVLLKALQVVVMAHGNVTGEEAKAYRESVERALVANATVAVVPRGSVVRLEDGARFRRVIEVEHQDSGIALYYQGASRLTRERARYALLRQIVASPFYLDLRTRQQLGYVVFATGMGMLEVPGISFVIQSPGTPPSELESRIREFLTGFRDELAGMTDEDFARHKAGLLTRILEKDKSLQERSDRYWREIDRRRFGFDSHEQLARAVRAVDKTELLAFYDAAIVGASARELSVWALGKAHRDSNAGAAVPAGITSVRSPEEFREGKDFFRSR